MTPTLLDHEDLDIQEVTCEPAPPDVFPVEQARHLTELGKEACASALLEDFGEAVSDAAADGQSHLAFDLGDEFMDGPVPHKYVIDKYFEPLVKAGYRVFVSGEKVLITWNALESPELKREIVHHNMCQLVEDQTPGIPDARTVYETWADKTLEGHMKSLGECLQRRPWGTYWVMPTPFWELAKEALLAKGWHVHMRRISSDGKRVHFKVSQCRKKA